MSSGTATTTTSPLRRRGLPDVRKNLPGGNTTGFSGEAKIGQLPLETCDTINGAWDYNATNKRFKSTKQLVHYLAKAAGMDASFLLIVGPKPDGTIQDEFVTRLREIGGWLKVNGESVYGTHGGPISPRPWSATTQAKGKVYVHILDWPAATLAIPRTPTPVKNASFGASGKPATVRDIDRGHLLAIPVQGRDAIDAVVVLEGEVIYN